MLIFEEGEKGHDSIEEPTKSSAAGTGLDMVPDRALYKDEGASSANDVWSVLKFSAYDQDF